MNAALATAGFQCKLGAPAALSTAGYQCVPKDPAPFVIVDITDGQVCDGIRIASSNSRLAVFFNGELLRENFDYTEGPGLSQIRLYRTPGPNDKITIRRL